MAKKTTKRKLPIEESDLEDIGSEYVKCTHHMTALDEGVKAEDWRAVFKILQIMHARHGAISEWSINTCTRIQGYLEAAGEPLPESIKLEDIT